MARRLARIAALTAFVIPSISAAIGVGSMQTGSALNEPLEARIPLESADLEELQTLSATLASPDAFDRAGLERPFMLSRLEFEVVTEDTREPYVLIRTSEPVREPFLAFLVELNWAGGRLIREYTMLLDPPVHSPEQEAAPAVADAPAADEPAPGADAPATVSPGAPAAGREFDTADEIQVQDNDTLWELADEVRDGVSVHQMMMALLEANPDAFSDGNVNNLRSGAILRVPEREAAEVLTAGEARQEFAAQVEAWQAGRAPEPAQPDPADEPAVADEETPPADDGRLEVVAAGETAGDDATASLMDDDLEASPETVARLQSELAAMREEEASLRSENEELRQQTAELMARVEALERTLDVQVEGALPGMTDEPVEEDIPLADAPEEATASDDEVAAVPEEELPALFDEDSALEQDLAALDEEPAVEAAEPVDEPADEAAPEADPAADVAVEDDEPAPAAADEPAAPQAPWEDARVMSMAGGAAALIALLVLVMIRRRRNAAQDASDMVAASAGAGVAAADADDETDVQQDVAADDDGAQEPVGRDGVDPLEEIEVYLAYGRYDQAGDLLASAIGNEPERTDLRLKQLEVHALTHDRAAFEADAQDLYGMVDGADDPVWRQVQEMGREIAPENPLFAAAAAPSGAGSTDELDDAPEPAVEIPEPSEEPAPAVEKPETGAPTPVAPATETDGTDEDDFGDLEFSLDDTEEDSRVEPPAAKAEENSAAPAEEDDAFSLDFDLDDFQAPADGGKAVAEPAGESDQPAEEPEGEDELSLDFEAWERPEGEQPKGGDAEASEALETGDDDDDAPSFNLDDLDVGDDPIAEEEGLRYDGPSAADDDHGTEEPLTPSDDEPGDGDSVAGAGLAGGDGDDDDDDLFDAGDENSTKLDLARAYLDMGDSEGAKSLLDEVIAEGSDEQKQEARSLYEEA